LTRRDAISYLLGLGTAAIGLNIPFIQRAWLNQLNTTTLSPEQTAGEITDAFELIEQALDVGQTKIYLPAGNYSVSQRISIANRTDVEIYGDGSASTILRLGDNVRQTVLSLDTVDGVYIHDLQIDGNRFNQPYSPPTPHYLGAVPISGIGAWNCSNILIEDCFIHDCRVFGVTHSKCTDCKVLNNSIQNCDANGVNIDNASGGSRTVVRGNTIDGASDVGITGSDAVDYTVENNLIRNILLDTSPFEQNTHIGLACESAASGCKNCNYSNNTIENVTGGIWVENTVGLTAIGNLICGIASPINSHAINIEATVSGADIENNTITGIPAHMQWTIVQLSAPSGIFKNNVIYANGNLAIWPSNPPGWYLSGNQIN
jgi:parallel beta-helix repeat protein